MKQLIQQGFQTGDEIVSAAHGEHSYSQTMEVELELGFGKVKVQNEFLACLVHDSVIAFVPSLAVILVQETGDPAWHVEAAEEA
jgi:DUF917 family protein